jgi:hypothetical protein
MTSKALPIPGTLNIVLVTAAGALACALLWLVSHTESWAYRLLGAVGFSYVGNTLFSLLHESVHRHFHRNPTVNEAFGIVCAAFFPTSLLFQRVVHFGHHRRNRTEWELFDHYQPGVPRYKTLFRLYCLLTGFFWLSAPLGCAIYLLTGSFFRSRIFQQVICRWYGFEPMVADLAAVPGWRMRLEIMFTVVFQTALVLRARSEPARLVAVLRRFRAQLVFAAIHRSRLDGARHHPRGVQPARESGGAVDLSQLPPSSGAPSASRGALDPLAALRRFRSAAAVVPRHLSAALARADADRRAAAGTLGRARRAAPARVIRHSGA